MEGPPQHGSASKNHVSDGFVVAVQVAQDTKLVPEVITLEVGVPVNGTAQSGIVIHPP